jgi:hypothetical protein
MDDETREETSLHRQSRSISHHLHQHRYTDEATKVYHVQLFNPRRNMLASEQRRPRAHR